MSAVHLRDVRKRFGRDHDATKAINGLDLTIEEGEFFVLLGPSGCGKTTTLRCVAGLEQPDGGEIVIGGRTVDRPQAGLWVPPEQRGIGMVFQSYALWPHMTVRQNVEYPLRARERAGRLPSGADGRRRQADNAMALVGLQDFAERYPAALSGGQQQRVALARAIAAEPELLLFDEPLSNLDAQLRLKLRIDLRRIQREVGHTAIYVTHDQSEALAVADRIAVMKQGRLEQLGTPAEIFLAPATRFVAGFVGFDNVIGAERAGIEGERLLLQPALAGWRPVALAPPNTRHGGQPIELAIRSSALKITPAGQRAAHERHGQGLLREVTYTGEHYLGVVDSAGQTLIGTLPPDTWGLPRGHTPSLLGQTVDLTLEQPGLAAIA